MAPNPKITLEQHIKTENFTYVFHAAKTDCGKTVYTNCHCPDAKITSHINRLFHFDDFLVARKQQLAESEAAIQIMKPFASNEVTLNGYLAAEMDGLSEKVMELLPELEMIREYLCLDGEGSGS
ncbi:MAG: hypothetical protein Q9183_005014 [Haloplaca sp. 2 TL-2023]